jgi:hypothetical protein
MLVAGVLLGYLILPVITSNWLKSEMTSKEEEKEHPEWNQPAVTQPVMVSSRYQTRPSKKGSVRVRKQPSHTDTVKSENITSNTKSKGQPQDLEMPSVKESIHDEDDDDDHGNKDIHNTDPTLKSAYNDASIAKGKLNEPNDNGIQARIISNHHIKSNQSLPTATTPYVMHTTKLPDAQRMKIMVTGGAGFVGSHLVDKLMMLGHEVIVVDNFFTGQKKNIEHWMSHPNFR